MNFKKMALVAAFLLLAVVSITRIAPWSALPKNHSHSIEQTDEKIDAVTKLSGGAAATSATLTLLPGDICTPLAEQLAELAKYFLLILSALYLEKFMITVSGYVTFGLLIPLALLVLAVAVLAGKRNWFVISAKIAFIGLVFFAIVPASVMLSDMVYQTQNESVNATIEEYNELEIGEGGSALGELTVMSGDLVDRISGFATGLMESLAVMIVTACAIPVLVLVLLVWLMKVLFAPGQPSLPIRYEGGSR